MPAPVPSFIQLPLDQANLGKLVRLDRRDSALPDGRHHFVLSSPRNVTGIYTASSGVLSVATTSHDAITTGFVWLENPVGSAITVALRRVEAHFGAAAAAAAASGPSVRANRFTFTGTASGAAITPALRDSNDAANVANLRTAPTGMSITLFQTATASAGHAYSMTIPAVHTAAHAMDGPLREWEPTKPEAQLQLLAGEGIAFYQVGNGVASDPRRLVLNIAWEEFET